MEFKRFALAMVGHFLASLLYVMRRLRLINAVVDTSSILEHREELRELWEKRMMADDNQTSSPSSTMADKTSPKAVCEKDHEETASDTTGDSVTVAELKLSNGVAKPVEDEKKLKVENNNHENHTEEGSVIKINGSHTISDNENNCTDSLEETADYVEERTYTSQLETSLVMKEEVSKAEDKAPEETRQEKDKLESSSKECSAEAPLINFDSCTGDDQSAEDLLDSLTPQSEHESESKKGGDEESKYCGGFYEEILVSEETSELNNAPKAKELEGSFAERQPLSLTLEIHSSEEGDGFIALEECLPRDENEEMTELDSASDNKDEKTAILNGHDDHSEISLPMSTPEPDEKPSHPEMEQFVKSGGLKRILPGVQKTEQPYSTCTTETKIAMEIREMREREEELRVMREQTLISPVASPVPPKSPSVRTPSPSVKETSTPSPVGLGYRVSNVFGHRGSTPSSPSPPVFVDEDKKSFKNFSAAESAVEKEIKMARDREEELRKQKGLPPREDDSFVKPSQVKSSQVRVFGKAVGSNNMKQAATAKIQLEIEEQTQREMALKETGSIQTISMERTDAKVATLKSVATSPLTPNGNSHPVTNGNYLNGRSSPDVAPYKRGTPSPTRPASIFSQTNGKAPVNMHKFIVSKGGKEGSAPKNGSPFVPREESRPVVPPAMVKLKRNPSVESKIQQEIMEMKQREEELKLLHMNKSNGNMEDVLIENELNQKDISMEYKNGNGIHEEELSPNHNKLIAQWEQRIQRAES